MICNHCDEDGADDSMPFVGVDGVGTVWFHRECQIRNVVGGLKHQARECPCFIAGSDNDPPDGMSLHEEAAEVTRLVMAEEWIYG